MMSGGGNQSSMEEDDDDDAEYYRQEVGQEPDPGSCTDKHPVLGQIVCIYSCTTVHVEKCSPCNML